MTKSARLCIRFTVLIGAIVSLLLGSTFIGLYFFAGQPVAHLLAQTSNYLAYQRTGIVQKIGKRLIHSGVVNDWDARAGIIDTDKDANPLLTAASPGQQFPYQRFDTRGAPIENKPGPFLAPENTRIVSVGSVKELLSAVSSARPGDIITLAPGHYRLNGRSIPVRQPGTAEKPIYVRSSSLGASLLEMSTLEGFHVTAPFWVFENLEIRGICDSDKRCEHAFHVTGSGRSFTLRNSKLADFNASIKVNGSGSEARMFYPDNGLLEYNQITNNRPRKTNNPVTLININSVNNWVVRGNFISDFSKNGGDHISYGAFMKGGGSNGLFERNMVICEHRLAPDRGIRIGLSLGGGGTGAKFCRNGDCNSEHTNGQMRNNIVLNCSRDVGIYLNRASTTRLYNNLLHNTLGIDIRHATSSATIINNIISGRIRAREGGEFQAHNNLIDHLCLGAERSNCSFDTIYAAPDLANFRLELADDIIRGTGDILKLVQNDFCNKPRDNYPDLGPIQYPDGLSCLKP